jgi:uncharacterized hydrophobic protein (TIGR00271 family)
VLHLRVFARSVTATNVAETLRFHSGVRHIVRSRTLDEQVDLLAADVEPDAADRILAELERLQIPPTDVSLLRLTAIAGVGRPGSNALSRGTETLVWAEVLGEARASARPIRRYVTLMIIAGIIGAFGVILRTPILIVGAMAVSPDLLPLAAACVGIAGGRTRLAARAIGTLFVGLGLAVATAAVLAFLLDLVGELPSGFRIGSGGLGDLTTVDVSTVVIALAAGVAAIVTFETRASQAVGVAISVTTIPAAAYFGVAIGVRQYGQADGALAVLAVNVFLILLSGTITLIAQRRVTRELPS